MASKITSSRKMSNSGWHRAGQPKWWVRVGEGSHAEFIDIPYARGDRDLDVTVGLPAGTTVHIGAGKGSDGVRQTVTTWCEFASTEI